MKKFICVLLAWTMLFTAVPSIEAQAATKISKPVITSVVESSGAKVTIKWKKNSSAKGYVIYRKTGKNGKYKKLKTIANNKTVKYVDTSTKDNTTYYYAVRAYKGKSYSLYSSAKKIKTTAVSKIQDIYNDCAGVLADTPTKVTFTACVSNGVRLKDKSLALYKGSTLVGYFVDNGKNGDGIAGDGLFTTVDTLNIGVDEYADYHVKYKKKEVESFSIRAFDAITDADMRDMMEIDSEINAISSEYEMDGIVAGMQKVSAINSVYGYAQQLKNEGKILNLRKNEYGVTVQLSSGIWYYYTPTEEYVNGSADKSVVTMQSYNLSGGELALPTEEIDNLAEKIVENVPNYDFDEDNNLDDEEVNLSALKGLSDNQVVIWYGHGRYDDVEGPILVTGISDNEQNNLILDESIDMLSGSIWHTKAGRIAVTPRWFSRNIKDKQLKNSLFFFTACHSGEDDKLANALISKGASAVVGFTNAVFDDYGVEMCKSVFEKMSEKNTNTGYYYSLDEALRYAKDVWGENHLYFAMKYRPEWDIAGYPKTEIIRFGNKNMRLTDESFVTLELSEKSLNLEEGKTAQLNATTNILDMQNVKWSISDSSIATLSDSEGKSITVKAKKAGKATVVCCVGDKKVICNLTVTGKKTDELSEGFYLTEHLGNDAVKEKTKRGVCKSAKISGNKLSVTGSFDFANYNDWTQYLVSYKTRTFVIDANCEFSWDYTGPNGELARIRKMKDAERFNYWFNNTDNNGAMFSVYISNGKVTRIEYDKYEGD